MNFYDPRKSYCGKDGKSGTSSRQIVEMMIDRNEFDECESPICLVFPHETIKLLLEKMPEIFGDIPPQKFEDMNEKGKQMHLKHMEDLKNPDSHAYKFAEWIDNKRVLQEHK